MTLVYSHGPEDLLTCGNQDGIPGYGRGKDQGKGREAHEEIEIKANGVAWLIARTNRTRRELTATGMA